MPMSPALLDMIARDQAARMVDPSTLTEREKAAKIFSLQGRVTEMEEIAEFLATLLLSIERETIGAGADDRAYRTRILALCSELKRCAIPITKVERVTGTETFVGRAL